MLKRASSPRALFDTCRKVLMIRAYKFIMSDVSKIIYREVLVKQLVSRRALFVVDYQEYVVKELFILLTWSKRDCRCVSL